MPGQPAAGCEQDVRDCRPCGADQQHWPASDAVGEPPPTGREQELHRRIGGLNYTDERPAGAKVPAVHRQQRQNYPEPNQVNEDGEENDQDRRLSHEQKAPTEPATPSWIRNNIGKVYLWMLASQAGGQTPSSKGGGLCGSICNKSSAAGEGCAFGRGRIRNWPR